MEETKQENLTGQYLTFDLADEQYAVDVGKVTSVLEMTQITKVPKTPEFMRGVINLRGSVVPVIDLRLKFGMSQTEQTQDTSIIVMEIELDGETVVIGALADSVHEVIEMDQNQIEAAPKFGTKLDTEFIKGIGKKEEGFLIILDIDKVFTSDEISAVSKKPIEQSGNEE
ncbi:MAG: chemotaxis protein CheW [Spirochaetia bacterium]